MNVYELLASTQRMLSDRSNRVWGSNAECLEHLQMAYLKVHGKFTAVDGGYGLIKKDYAWVTPDENTREAEYRLPPSCETIKSVALLDSSSRVIWMAVPHDLVELQAGEVRPAYAYYFRRGTLIIVAQSGFTASSSVATVRVHYYRTAAELSVFQPAAVSGQNITLPSAPYDGLGKMLGYDAAYEGVNFEVVSGSGVGEVYEITGYTGSTRIAVAHSSTTPTANTSSVLSVIPAVPERSHPLICYMAAMDGARIEENMRQYKLLADEQALLWKSIEGTLTMRQVQAASAVQSAYD